MSNPLLQAAAMQLIECYVSDIRHECSIESLQEFITEAQQLVNEQLEKEFREFEQETQIKAAKFGKRAKFEDIKKRGRRRKNAKGDTPTS